MLTTKLLYCPGGYGNRIFDGTLFLDKRICGKRRAAFAFCIQRDQSLSIISPAVELEGQLLTIFQNFLN